MYDKMAISAYILKIVENYPFLRLQMRAKEMFNRHQFFSTDNRYVEIKLMRNETNLWSIFGKDEIILVKLWFKGLNYHNFHILIVTNFKTDRYLNNFQEHLVGILRRRIYQTSLQNFFPTWERAY